MSGNISETFNAIAANRTLIACRLTGAEVVKPEIVQGLHTLAEVFDHYRPVLFFSFEDRKDIIRSEELTFRSVEDFSPDCLNRNSVFLKRKKIQIQTCLKLAALLKSNQELREALTDKKKREAFQVLVKTMIADLKTIK